MDVKALIIILMSSVLVDNYVLNRFLGICPFLGVSKKVNQSVGMGAAVIFVMLVATAVTWPIQTFILNPLNMGYMQTIAFILIMSFLFEEQKKRFLIVLIVSSCLSSSSGFFIQRAIIYSLYFVWHRYDHR